jgi:hypothetical protein
MTFAKYPVSGSGGGTGDVVGPASSTDSAVVLFDGTTGKLIKDSVILSSAIVLTSGNQTIGGTKTFSSAPSAPSVGLTSATNQLVLGTTNTTTISAAAPAASRVYTLPDAGSAADFVLTAGTQTIGGTKTFSSAVTINPASNQLVLASGVNQLTLNSGTSAAARTYAIPDAGASASFVMTAGTQTIGGTLTLPATVTYTSNGSIVKSGAGALTITNASAAGLTFAGTGTVTAPTGTYTLAGLSLGNVFTVAQTVSATTNQIVLGTTNTTTINSAAPAASRTYNIIDAGGVADFVMTAATQTIGGAKTFSSAVTINPASNQLVLASGVNQLTLNSSTSAAARTYSFPDVGATGSVAMLEGAQTFSGLKTFSAGVAITGGTAATQVLSVSGTTWTIGNGPTITEAGAAAFATSVTSPLIVGGSSVSQVLTIKSTTGIGTSDRIDFVVGNNGAVTGLSIGTAGACTLGPTSAISGTTYAGNLIVGKCAPGAIAAGYVGESRTNTATYTGATTTGTTIATITNVTPGIYMVYISAASIYSSGSISVLEYTARFTSNVSLTPATSDYYTNNTDSIGFSNSTAASTAQNGSNPSLSFPFQVTATTTYYLRLAMTATGGGSVGVKGQLTFVRVA